MKKIKFLLLAITFGLIIASAMPVKAQCAMCTVSVESSSKSGSKTTKGLNAGILYLLGAPYLAVSVCGYIWYKKYRRKEVNLNMRSEKLNLN